VVSKSRREVLQRALSLASAAIAAPIAARAAECGDPDAEPLRGSMHYGAAPSPDKACAMCAYFTADSSGSCGACQIMGGPVDKGSHCDSWEARAK